ncbi:putative amidohydrolase domain containing protein [Botrytis fragariae]|uniref:Putative amidohydrolase domain containing protein n=1 Tax=Botrytis fragariae TaxID=1964551 RepID=A0A8H6EEK8_9HELO|nr:putative amidohydrolase domain containing protein [Botrytis fragariae]KAF5869311.1 putative amidohydrolase domain containing protein [Botrytis fragariae]
MTKKYPTHGSTLSDSTSILASQSATANSLKIAKLIPFNSSFSSDHEYWIHTTTLFNSRTKTFDKNVSLQVNTKTGLITRVSTRENSSISSSLGDNDIDLRGKTVLPGFVDVHTHVFLHRVDEAGSPYLNQERDESLISRAIRATTNCRLALLAGYTTYRDLGLKDAIMPILVGSYEIRQENKLGGTETPRLSDPCDGVEGCRAGVRRRIGAGADVIKIYAEYRRRALRYPASTYKGSEDIQFPPSRNRGEDIFGPREKLRNPNSLLWSQEEMNVMVAEAKRAGVPVASHASSEEAVIMAAKAGVTSVEHGLMPSEKALEVMKEMGTIYVPTLSVVELEANDGGRAIAICKEHAKRAWEIGVKLATGCDTGPFPHGENAREMELMVQAGINVADVLRAATLGGWEACGGELCGQDFGWLGEDWIADLVALGGDLEKDGFEKVIRNVSCVIKDGRLVVADGKIVGFV